ncbi:alpha/beta hydrolase [Aurantimonas sp. VKM B-3413]|uniref:alpha/beta hydrolase n=1 Tax=Aurantimonas sp. VKM B-3413 TaxID=2779401 RepID=UPI001E313A35|nr:alpha/beta hydrolase [Aurantimonas sp. VKM B-3413]MCB8840830.1 alpha/beta hydrolase [Aurantimonas sp. VKM B-3413]
MTMLDPQAKAVLDELARRQSAQPEPRDDGDALANARAMTGGLADFSGAPEDVAAVEDIAVDSPAGPIPVRLYRPAGEGRLPLLIWYHGGGGMAGSLQSHDAALRSLANSTARAIAAVDYRLAPDHSFPAPHEDCFAATRALAAQAEALGCDPGRIAIGGDSIGGLFALVVALELRDAGETLPEALVVLYPNSDFRPDRDWPSLTEESGHVMTVESLAYENDLYVPDRADRYAPEASPFLAPDLSRLPRTLFVTCERDPLRDEGEAFATRLAEAGVSLIRQREPGMIHGFLQMGGWIGATAGLRDRIAAFLDA